jgi:hypothetical protein
VFHITANPDGTFHETSTVVGNLLFEQNDGVTFTGKFTSWDGENVNNKNATFTAPFHFTAFGSDGSKLSEHAVIHISLNTNGTVTATVRQGHAALRLSDCLVARRSVSRTNSSRPTSALRATCRAAHSLHRGSVAVCHRSVSGYLWRSSDPWPLAASRRGGRVISATS